jgi:hypothetical protein
VAEPRVAFELPAINFGRVLVGVRAKQVVRLVNSEDEPFTFALDSASYDASPQLVASTRRRPALEITPVQGTVGGACMHAAAGMSAAHLLGPLSPALEWLDWLTNAPGHLLCKASLTRQACHHRTRLPSTPQVPPKGSIELTATFAPDIERDVNYSVACRVKKKPCLLTLNVKGSAYAIHDSLQLEEPGGQVGCLALRPVPLGGPQP